MFACIVFLNVFYICGLDAFCVTASDRSFPPKCVFHCARINGVAQIPQNGS